MKRYQWLIMFMCLAYPTIESISCVGGVKKTSKNTEDDELDDDPSDDVPNDTKSAECMLTCEGCCDAQGECQNLVTASACGISGNICKTCSTGNYCVEGRCQGSSACTAENCSGCCENDDCKISVTGDACGTTGVPCIKCVSGQCQDGKCTDCTPDCTNKCQNEPDGCGGRCPDSTGCLGCCTPLDVCVPGLQNDLCGKNGSICEDCNKREDGAITCIGNRCKQSCNDGCIGNNECQPGNQPTLCGSDGQVCFNCEGRGQICSDRRMCINPDGSCDTSQTRWIPGGHQDGSWCVTGQPSKYCTRANYEKEQRQQAEGSTCIWVDTGNTRLRDCWSDHLFSCEAGKSCSGGECKSDATCDTSKTQWVADGYVDGFWCMAQGSTQYCTRRNKQKEQVQKVVDGVCKWVDTSVTKLSYCLSSEWIKDCPSGQTCNDEGCVSICDKTQTVQRSENGFWCLSDKSGFCTTVNYTIEQKQVKDTTGNCVWQDQPSTKKIVSCWTSTVVKCGSGTTCNSTSKACIGTCSEGQTSTGVHFCRPSSSEDYWIDICKLTSGTTTQEGTGYVYQCNANKTGCVAVSGYPKHCTCKDSYSCQPSGQCIDGLDPDDEKYCVPYSKGPTYHEVCGSNKKWLVPKCASDKSACTYTESSWSCQ